ncbi:Uu.00g112060.m01.CDS01 [Anthostomella pinea]|uniref:Copper transport protein n=1 Tax=Anthostomella pinea TaxID=933095 RepID=A0AAI8VF87_9PEZI|nr:Uu.00g112060.m01.CDS01 [Anthostomella pinea]
MDMSNMDMGDNSSSSMTSQMMAVFQNKMATSLYSKSWTPSTSGAYAGTIIFLIILGIALRLLLAGKSIAEARWLDAEMNRRYVVVQGKLPLAETLSRDDQCKRMTLSENGIEEEVMVVQKRTVDARRPWRLSVDPLRATLDTLIAAVSYLLMLAVMSMNIGYFLAVLAGTFLGSLLVGRYHGTLEH